MLAWLGLCELLLGLAALACVMGCEVRQQTPKCAAVPLHTLQRPL